MRVLCANQNAVGGGVERCSRCWQCWETVAPFRAGLKRVLACLI